MPTSIVQSIDAHGLKELESVYGPAKDQTELNKQVAEFKATEKALRELMKPNRVTPRSVPNVSMKEAVHGADFKILFPKVVIDVLQRPREPMYLGQNYLAKTIQVEGARIIQFPTFGAIRAFELGDAQEPIEQDPSFTKNITEIRVRRFGLKLEVTEEVIEESQWDILALYTEAAGNAMMRKKEELIFNEFQTRSVTLFDNSDTDTTMHTTGKSADGDTINGTLDHLDLLDMMAALGANGYNPTDILLHPLAWAIWAKDPILRFQLLYQGGVGQTVGNLGAFSFDPDQIKTYVPFGVNIIVSPFQTLNYNTTLTQGVTGFGAANYTTVTVLDRNSSVLIMQRTPMQIAQFDNPMRDIRTLMFHEKYGLSIMNGGRSAVQATNVRIDQNFNPVYTIRTVAAS